MKLSIIPFVGRGELGVGGREDGLENEFPSLPTIPSTAGLGVGAVTAVLLVESLALGIPAGKTVLNSLLNLELALKNR